MMYLRSVLLGALLAIFAVPAVARPGDFDPSFGVGGKLITSLARYSGGFDVAQAAIVQDDGRILVAEICEDGDRNRTCIVRFEADGNIDGTFGRDGFVRLENGIIGSSMPSRLIADGSGTIISAACPDQEGSCLFRLTASGAPDQMFGTNGVALSTIHKTIYALARQGSALLAAGRCMAATSLASALCLWRFLPDGTLDANFGNQGTVTSAVPIVSYDRFETDIVVAGPNILVGTTCVTNTSVPPVFCALRFALDGSIDSSFGVAGIARVSVLDGYHRFNKLVVDGPTFYTVGTCATLSAPSANLFCLARFDTDGALDSSFGPAGKVTATVGATNSDAAGSHMAPGGLIVAGYCQIASMDRMCTVRVTSAGVVDPIYGDAGLATSAVPQIPRMAIKNVDFSTLVVSQCNVANDSNLCLTRINLGGSLDTTFGVNGTTNVSLGSRIANETPSLVVAGESGKFLTAGGCANPAGQSTPCVARFMPNGDLDLSLASAGFIMLPMGNASARIDGIANDGGNILMATRCAIPATGASTPCVFRYMDNGTLDASFGTGGFVEVAGVNTETKMTLHGGKLVVVGNCANTSNEICVTKMNLDGTPDATFGINGRSKFVVPMKNAFVGGIVSDGTAVVIWSACNIGSPPVYGSPLFFQCMARILPDGSVDVTYGNLGPASHPFGFTTAPISADNDGNQMVVVGQCGYTGLSCLLRFLPNGILDAAFGDFGNVFITGMSPSIKLAHGRIFVTVRCATSPASICHYAYMQNGQIDRSFGTNGMLQYAIGIGATTPMASLLLGEKLLTASSCTHGPSNPIYLFCHSLINLAAVAPQPPTLQKATPGAGNAFFDFTPSIDDGGSDVSSVTLTCNPGSLTVGGVISPIILSGMTNDQIYNCTIRATNAAGTSLQSNALMVTPSISAIELVTVGSRKSHIGAGDFVLPVTLRPAAGLPVTIEPRAGDGYHDILLSFTQPVAAIGAMTATDAHLVNYDVSTYSNAGTTMVVRIAGVPDKKRVTLRLMEINGTLDVAAPIGFFIADVNGSGKITAADIVAIKRKVGANINDQNFRFDINRSGAISADDVSIAKSRSGQLLGP